MKIKRKIIEIDEERCDGCGNCILACAEGSLELVDGKARVIGENLCDGLGACIGECPRDALKIVEREAEEFDEAAVEEHLARREKQPLPKTAPASSGCPSARLETFADLAACKGANAPAQFKGDSRSALSHWPVQIRLIPPNAPFLKGADLLVVADCVTLVARLDVERLAWVGTSMGGLIGMTYAAMPGNPIARLLLNDVGPVLDPAGLARIGTYVGKAPTFDTYEQGKAYTMEVSASFGPHDPAGWDILARHYWVEDGGRWRVHYDPRIAEPIVAGAGQPVPELWFLWDAIRCPSWVVRGSASDLLSSEVAQAMTERGPRV